MSKYRFAGTLKAVKAMKEGTKSFRLLHFVPDAEYTVPHKNGGLTQKVVVFHPMGKWENGLSYFYDDDVVFKTECCDLFGIGLGSHCELEIEDSSVGSLLDFSLQAAPTCFGTKSIVSIRAL